MKAVSIALVIVAFFDVVVLTGIVLVTKKITGMKPQERRTLEAPKKPEPPLTLRRAVAREKWILVRKHWDAGTPEELKLAVIEADKVVDDTLKQVGLQGEHMADRLSQLSQREVKTLQRVWNAHRVRNDLVHTPGFGLTRDEALRALRDFESFLRELEAI